MYSLCEQINSQDTSTECTNQTQNPLNDTQQPNQVPQTYIPNLKNYKEWILHQTKRIGAGTIAPLTTLLGGVVSMEIVKVKTDVCLLVTIFRRNVECLLR